MGLAGAGEAANGLLVSVRIFWHADHGSLSVRADSSALCGLTASMVRLMGAFIRMYATHDAAQRLEQICLKHFLTD